LAEAEKVFYRFHFFLIPTASAEIILLSFERAGMCGNKPEACKSSNQHATLCAAELE